MEFSALLTSAGINIGVCVLFLSLYSILRKQPHNFSVYFGRRLAEEKFQRQDDYFSFERLLPTAGWIVKAYWCTEEEIRQVAGLDSVVFLRLFIFSIRIFSITSLVCIFGVLPVNYHGKEMTHNHIPAESLNVFTIANIIEESRKLWVHCIALYIITISACILLYNEYKYISRKRLAHITGGPPNPSQFTVLVRSIPRSDNELLDDTIRNFFVNYHGSSYLSHQVILRRGHFQRFVDRAEKAYRKFVSVRRSMSERNGRSSMSRCGVCGVRASSFQVYRNKFIEAKKEDLTNPEVVNAQKATFFITYVLTSGWASLCSEILQVYNLVYNFFSKCICCCQQNSEYVYSFPYHTEVPKVLMFNLLGFAFAIMAPLILPFLLVYFCLGYLVYRNQILNVYYPKYEMGGKLWPIMHNTIVFSLVLMQVIALGVFTIKKSPVASGFTILLLVGTILFNEYCRHRFSRIFEAYSAQDVIELDRDDEQSGRMQEIHQHLQDAYSQTTPGEGSSRSGGQVPIEMILEDPAQDASESSQELCDTVQEMSDAIHEHNISEEGKAHSV
nr:unnamed protein product [Digitaria exilis]